MSVVVRMEMPQWCWNCPCVNGEYGYCQADKEERQIEGQNERPSWCPIIAVSPWHRVEEPPKVGQIVLTMDANEDMETAIYDGEVFEDSYGFYITNVLYWMPIEPPKEDA